MNSNEMIQSNLFKKALKFLEVTYLNQQELNTTGKGRTTHWFLRTVCRLFLQRWSNVCSLKEFSNFESFSNFLLPSFKNIY